MILALAFAAAIQGGNPVMEVVDPSAKFVSVQAVVKLPELTGRERCEAKVIADTIADDVEGYVTDDMRNIAARAGDGLRVTLMPDHLRLQIGVLPTDVKPALAYLSAILQSSRLPAASLNKAMTELPYRNRSLWSIALEPYKLKFDRVRRDDIVDLYHRICRPENVWVAVGGPITPGEAEDYWTSKTKDWKPGKLPRRPFDDSLPERITAVSGRENVVELQGTPILGTDAAISARLMAMIAIGSGKGSLMFDRLRERHGWSYRQEAVLWPTTTGFAPRFIMASGDKTPPDELAAAMKKELLDGVNALAESDVTRARGMAEAILLRNVPTSPLYFNPSWPISTSLHDRTFLAAYWPMKTGREWDARKMVGQMALATVDDVKQAALDMLTNAIPRTIPANQ